MIWQKRVRNTLVFLAAIAGVFFLAGVPAYALSTFLTSQGGTGTTSPSGVLYGDNNATNHLNTATIGSGLQFSAGTLSTTFAFPFTPFSWGNSTSTVIGFPGIIVTGSSTFSNLATGALYSQGGLLLSHATTSSVVASQDVWRDGNSNVFANNFVPNLTSTVSSGGTVVLTPASSRYQLLTGSSNHTYQMPNGNASGMNTGATWDFNNNSTGVLHVQTHGGAFIADVPAGGFTRTILTDNSTSEGSWETHAYLGHLNTSQADGLGLGTTTPFAQLSIHANPNAPVIYKTLFAIGSSTNSATSTLFSIDNNGLASTTNLVVSGLGSSGTTCVQASASGQLSSTGSACGAGGGSDHWATTTSTLFPNAVFPSNGVNTLVGIGTTTPSAQLEVASSSGTQLRLSDTTNAPFNLRAINNTLYVATSSPTTFATNTTPLLSVDSSQALTVGVGTSSPWGFFSINPNAQGTGPDFVVGSSTATHLVVTNAGRVGIGSSTPYTKLGVVGTSTFNGDTVIGGDSSDLPNPYLIIATSSTPIYGRIAGDIIDAQYNWNGQSSINIANGNLGSCASATFFADGNNPTLSGFYATFSFLNDGWTGSGCSIGAGTGQKAEAAVLANPTGEMDFVIGSTTTNGFADFNWFSNTNTQLMKLTNAGNLGIGTTTPKWNLQVATGTAPQLTLSDASAANAPHNVRSINSALYISTSSPTTFATTSVPILAITKDGWTGIGTSSPGTFFSVDGVLNALRSGVITFLAEIIGKDATNGWFGRISPTHSFVLSTATTTTWTASTSPSYSPSLVMPFAGTLRQVRCLATTTSAFIGVQTLINTSAPTPSYFVASNTVGVEHFSASNTFNAGDRISVYFGTTTTDNNATSVTCTFDTTETP